MGKREPEVRYRTIDGGHPAPYPDMTDEQLYNYEVTFNVPRRTFDRPPVPVTPRGEEVTIRREPRLVERPAPQEAAPPMTPSFSPSPSPSPASAPASGRSFDAPRYTARPARETRAEQVEQLEQPTQAFTPSAPSAPSSAASGSAAVQAHPDLQPTQIPPTRMPPPLDFSRPVRLITTKQPVEIITTRARHPVYKVHGYIGDDDVVTVFTHDGRLSENGLRYLENVPQQHQLYVNVYANTDPLSRDRYLLTQHESREHADAAAQAGRLACVAVELDG
ncbi:hypothetical protein [Noviherbaspirillum album]|nr:hypothetical protein [Noviherbaspirillum sp. CPCC 100848]